MRLCIYLATALLIAACSPAPVAVAPTAVPPTIAPSVVPVSPTPAAVWRDKLNGVWRNDTQAWTFDLDAETMRASVGGVTSTGHIAFDHEEGKTVYCVITGQAGARTDTFRFINENTMVWTLDGEERTFQRES